MTFSILVVDDERSVRDLIAVMLECEGYEVHTAENGVEGIEKARALHPDLVTLDVMMPDLDGWSVSRVLAADPSTAHIRKVIVSAKPLDELERSPDRDLVEAVLTKPFDFASFTELIAGLLKAEPAA
jgi:CheY-like chemotaxis protein